MSWAGATASHWPERLGPARTIKVFWFFFSKKNCFLNGLESLFIWLNQAGQKESANSMATRMAALETRVAVITWMVGANITLTVVTLGVLTMLSYKVGEISGQIMHLGH
jgi:hypothetical protein